LKILIHHVLKTSRSKYSQLLHTCDTGSDVISVRDVIVVWGTPSMSRYAARFYHSSVNNTRCIR